MVVVLVVVVVVEVAVERKGTLFKCLVVLAMEHQLGTL